MTYGKTKAEELYQVEMLKYPLLKRKEEIELGRKIQAGDNDAREKFICCNLRLVVKIAFDYQRETISIQDLIAEGNIGLIKAVDRYDPDRGIKFSTYASWWIRQRIMRAICNTSRTIRIPVHLIQQSANIGKYMSWYELKYGEMPTKKQIMRKFKIPEWQVDQMRMIYDRHSSLDDRMGEGEDGILLGEMIEDDNAIDPSEDFRKKAMIEDLNEAIADLDRREQEIIKCRFGMGNRDRQTLEQVGLKFRVTRERIRQIEEVAIEKIRRKLNGLDMAGVLRDMGFGEMDEDAQLYRDIDALLERFTRMERVAA